MLDTIAASSSVNQARFGTSVREADRNAASSSTNGSQTANTKIQLKRYTTIATNVIMFVVINVTRITHTCIPYACPSRVVC
jgi:hypothetical protein